MSDSNEVNKLLSILTEEVVQDTRDLPEEEYEVFLKNVKKTFEQKTKSKVQLFTVELENVFDIFLDALPKNRKKHYNCRACKRFFNKFGNVVSITDEGKVKSVLWETNSVPEFFKPAVDKIISLIENSKVSGVFISDEKVWGISKNKDKKSETGVWEHFAVTPRPEYIYTSKINSPSQAIAEKKEEFLMLERGLEEYSEDNFAQAYSLLNGGNLVRSEKCVGVAKWLLALKKKTNVEDTKIKENLIWNAASIAPPGFTHIKNSMIGSLLDDIKDNLELSKIKQRFADKMDPMKYLRPTAPAKEQNINQAEKLVEKLGIEPALHRRYARLDEIKTLWSPPILIGNTKSVKVNQPSKVMTFYKFRKTILPIAESINIVVGSGNSQPFVGLVTAVNQDAPPIIQWDLESQRNPVSLYVYNSGSSPSRWNIAPGLNKVNAVTLSPQMWNDEEKFSNQSNGVIFIIDKCKDVGSGVGLCLFPEILKSELHSVRSTIEQHSNKGKMQGQNDASACGLIFRNDFSGCELEVVVEGIVQKIKIDRLD